MAGILGGGVVGGATVMLTLTDKMSPGLDKPHGRLDRRGCGPAAGFG